MDVDVQIGLRALLLFQHKRPSLPTTLNEAKHAWKQKMSLTIRKNLKAPMRENLKAPIPENVKGTYTGKLKST